MAASLRNLKKELQEQILCKEKESSIRVKRCLSANSDVGKSTVQSPGPACPKERAARGPVRPAMMSLVVQTMPLCALLQTEASAPAIWHTLVPPKAQRSKATCEEGPSVQVRNLNKRSPGVRHEEKKGRRVVILQSVISKNVS